MSLDSEIRVATAKVEVYWDNSEWKRGEHIMLFLNWEPMEKSVQYKNIFILL